MHRRWKRPMMVTAVALLALAGAACTDATSSVKPASPSDAMAETSATAPMTIAMSRSPRGSPPSPPPWRRRTSAAPSRETARTRSSHPPMRRSRRCPRAPSRTC